MAARSSGVGCAKCRPNVSKLELRVYAELSSLFPGTKRQRKLWDKEFDIVVPDIKLCVEVDGYPWHQDKKSHDLLKLKLSRQYGYQLIRIRDERLPKLQGIVIAYKEAQRTNQHRLIKELVREALKNIQVPPAARSLMLQYLKSEGWRADIHYKQLLSELPGPGADRSIAMTHPEMAAEWHPTRNGKLKPTMVSSGSGETVWWKCNKRHEWSAPVYAKRKCPFCLNLRATAENSIAALYPDVAKQWHPTRNGSMTPDQVPAGSGKRFW